MKHLPLFPAAFVIVAGCGTNAVDPNQQSFFVEVGFTAQADGSVTEVEVLRTDAPPALQQHAIDTVSKHRLKPGPVARARRMVRFTLDRGKSVGPSVGKDRHVGTSLMKEP